MASQIAEDPRIDPHIKTMLAAMKLPALPDVSSREELLALENSNEAVAGVAGFKAFLESCDTEEVASSRGLTVRTERFTSSPDRNLINIQFIRPEGDAVLACVYDIHGGGMASMSCYDGNYRAWGRNIAANGVAVAMGDFRNAVHASSAPQTAPYPAGRNDCVAGLKWVHANSASLGIGLERIVIAGESGGGNLTLATGLKLNKDRDISLIKGLYAQYPISSASGRCRRTRPPPRTRAS
jgi:acetyl esterase